jgi:hypothetical protein
MNVEIGAETAQFPEKEYVNGIVFAVYADSYHCPFLVSFPFLSAPIHLDCSGSDCTWTVTLYI